MTRHELALYRFVQWLDVRHSVIRSWHNGRTTLSSHNFYPRGIVTTTVARGLVAAQAGFTRDMLVQLARNSLEIAWVSDAERARLLGELDAFVATN